MALVLQSPSSASSPWSISVGSPRVGTRRNEAKWKKRMTKLQQLHLDFGNYMKSRDHISKKNSETHLEETKNNDLASNHPHLGSSPT